METLHALAIARMASELNNSLSEALVHDCFSTNKNQFFLHLKTRNASWLNIQIRFEGKINAVQFPEFIQREHPHRLTQFDDIIGQKIDAIRSFPGERSMEWALGQNRLLFRFHGGLANIFLIKEEEITDSFRKVLERDPAYVAQLINSVHEWPSNEESFSKASFFRGDLEKEYTHLHLEGLHFQDYINRWKEGRIYLLSQDDSYTLYTDARIGKVLAESDRFTEVVDPWSELVLGSFYFSSKKKQLLQEYQQQLKSAEKRLKALKLEAKQLQQQKNYKHLGDLILSHIHQYIKESTSISVQDYLNNEPLEIPLKSTLNAQENATRYYRKAKNQHLQEEKIQSQTELLMRQIAELEQQQNQVEKAESMAELRNWNKQKQKQSASNQRLPYHEFELSGFKLLVGKQAKDNDILSLKIAKKDDLWLHARDVSGSHVIIRKQAGRNFPDSVIEAAAGLALWFSKRRTEALAPVIYTEKKFIRKRKGDPAGAVVVEKENVWMASPLDPRQLGK
ncbi:MAG: DUF814 domain-containing protein [Bacteroidetes bacterium]|nr:DUF814 domain-containing protein [Bacteroidota bacterium]